MNTDIHELRNLADLALRMCRSSLTKTKGVEPVIVIGLADGTTQQCRLPEEFHELFGSGMGKDLLFNVVREAVEHFKAVSAVFGTEAWVGKSTELAHSLPDGEFDRLSRKHSVTELAEMGFVERTEEIVVTAQNAESMIVIHQPFRRSARGECAVSAPGYWMYEQGGELGPAVRRYLEGGALTTHEISLIRAYLEQWVDATGWDANPAMDDFGRKLLAELRRSARDLDSRDDIQDWIHTAVEFGMDPL